MARRPGSLGGSYNGTLLDQLVVSITADLSGLKRGIREAIAEINGLKAAIVGRVGGVSTADAIQAALIAPMVVAGARIGQVRNEMRLLATEMRNVAAIGYAGAGNSRGGLVPYVGGGPIIDAQRSRFPTRGSRGQMRRTYGVESDDLAGAAGMSRNGLAVPPIILTPGGLRDRMDADNDRREARPDEPDEPRGRRRRGWFARTFSPSRTRRAFDVGRRESPGFADASDELGMSANRVGQAGRRAAGGRIASMLGLVGVGALFGDLIRLGAALATVIGGTLAGAFAALATPLGVVIALITGLVALFVASNWDTFREFGEWFGTRARTLLSEGVGDIVTGFRNLTGAFGELWAAIQPIMGDESGALMRALQLFGEIALRVINAVMELLGGLLNTLAEIVRGVAALIRGDWADAWGHFGSAVETAFRAVVETINSLFPEIRDSVDAIANWLVERFNAIPAAVRNFFGMGTSGRDAAPTVTTGTARPRAGFEARGGAKSGGAKGFMGAMPAGVVGAVGAANDNSVSLAKELDEIKGRAGEAARALISMGRAIIDGARAGDVMRSALLQLRDRILNAGVEALTQMLTNLFATMASGGKGGKGGKGGGWIQAGLEIVGSVFAGGFAKGGFIPPGQWGIVGENGPEIAFGGRNGQTITPMSAGSGISIYMPIKIDAPGADAAQLMRVARSVESLKESLPSQIAAKVGDMRQRGRL